MGQLYDEKIRVDNEGFLVNFDGWNEDIAQILAEREGVSSLNEGKMEIIRFMRDYYAKFSAFPMLSYVCKKIHQPKECVNEEFVDPMKAWKIAGLPKPSGVEFITVDGGEKYQLNPCD